MWQAWTRPPLPKIKFCISALKSLPLDRIIHMFAYVSQRCTKINLDSESVWGLRLNNTWAGARIS